MNFGVGSDELDGLSRPALIAALRNCRAENARLKKWIKELEHNSVQSDGPDDGDGYDEYK